MVGAPGGRGGVAGPACAWNAAQLPPPRSGRAGTSTAKRHDHRLCPAPGSAARWRAADSPGHTPSPTLRSSRYRGTTPLTSAVAARKAPRRHDCRRRPASLRSRGPASEAMRAALKQVPSTRHVHARRDASHSPTRVTRAVSTRRSSLRLPTPGHVASPARRKSRVAIVERRGHSRVRSSPTSRRAAGKQGVQREIPQPVPLGTSEDCLSEGPPAFPQHASPTSSRRAPEGPARSHLLAAGLGARHPRPLTVGYPPRTVGPETSSCTS